jgi:hypothetical protein
MLIAILFVTGCGSKPDAQAVIPGLAEDATLAASIGVPGDGNVIALGVLDTLRYLQLVFKGDPSTFIMRSPTGQFLFAWAIKGNAWGFLGMDANGTSISELAKFCGAQYSNCLTFTGLVKYLETHGWNYVMPSAVPPGVISVFGSVSAFMAKFGSILVSPLPIIIVLPGVGDFVNPFPGGVN